MYKLITDGKELTLSKYDVAFDGGSLDCNDTNNSKIKGRSILPSIQNPLRKSLQIEPIPALQHANTDKLILIQPAVEGDASLLDSPQQRSTLQGTGGISSCTKRKHAESLKTYSIVQNPSINSENLAITNFMRNQIPNKDFRHMLPPCVPVSVVYDKSDGSLTKQGLDSINSTFDPQLKNNRSTTNVQPALTNVNVASDMDIENSQRFDDEQTPETKSLEGEVLNLDYDFSCEDRDERPPKRRSAYLWMIIDENDSSQNNLQTRMDCSAVIENLRKNRDHTAIAMEGIDMHSGCYGDESNENSSCTKTQISHGIDDLQRGTSNPTRNDNYQGKHTVDLPVYCTPQAVAKESIDTTTAHISKSSPPLRKIEDPREAESFQRVLASYDEPLVLDDQAQPFDRKQIDTAHIDTPTSDVKYQHESGSVEVHLDECAVLVDNDGNESDGDEDEDDNVNITDEPSGGPPPPPTSRDTDEMFSQFTELDKLQFDKVYSKRKMELEMQAETRARTISARWAKEGLSLQTIIDTALKDYIELYENAHALRLQFEAEKEIWKKSAMESMHKDPDSDRYQKQKTCANCNQFGGQSMYPQQSREWGSTDDGHWGHSQPAGGNKGSAYGDGFWGGNGKLLYAAEDGSTKDIDEELNPPMKGTTTALGDAEPVNPFGSSKSSHYGYKGKHDRQFDQQAAGLTIQKPFQPPKSKSVPSKSGKN